ncbi:MAG: hypothetical protein ABI192_09135 [Bradyrhizobium sp.]
MAELDDIVLENLHHVRGAIDDVRDDIRKIKQRVRNLENQWPVEPIGSDGRAHRAAPRSDRRVSGSLRAYPTFSASHIFISD